MSEQTIVTPQQVEQPAVTVPTTNQAEVATPKIEKVEQGQGAGQEQAALTEQKVLDLIEKRANEIAEKKAQEAIKQAQSLTDKLDARFRKEVADRFKAFEAVTGQPLTEAQKYTLEKQTREQIIAEQQPEQPAQPVQQEHPLMADVRRIADNYGGTVITDHDPEFASVKTDGTLGEWYTTYERAVKAKRDRTTKQTPSTEVTNENPQARIATTPKSGTSGLADNLSSMDYFKQAYKK